MQQFKAESKKLLDLVINSIYTQKDVFLRELISNASDAYDKLLLAQGRSGDEQARNSCEIELSFDAGERTVTVSDNGVGMSAAELEENLGTIAHSSSLALKTRGEVKRDEDVDIIGQFGVGFYSCFMAAERVEVVSRALGADEANVWKSDGVEGFEVEPAERAACGTDVVLHLRESGPSFDYDKFLSHSALAELVKRYSDYIRYPIVMETRGRRQVEPEEGAKNKEPVFEDYTERVVLNTMTPIWTRPRNEVGQSDYDEFYMKEFDDPHPPLRTISMHARGGRSCDVLLFIPSEPAPDFYSGEFKKGLELYSSNVLIQQSCPDLLSEAFGFLRGVVDSPDISLNLSRETLQNDRFLKAIAAQISKRVKAELEDMRDNERDTYVEFFGKFGRIFKFAIYATFGAQNAELEDLLMFFTAGRDEPCTLREYRDAMPAGQPCLLFASGNDAEKLEASPSVAAAAAQGYDVLLCTDSIDEFALMTLREYDSLPIKNVTAQDLELGDEAAAAASAQANADNAELFSFMRAALEPHVVEVEATARLTQTPACIVAKGAVSLGMERYFASAAAQDGVPSAQHALELNPEHEVFATLRRLWENGDEDGVKRYAIVLHGQALLAEGLEIPDLPAYSKAVCELL